MTTEMASVPNFEFRISNFEFFPSALCQPDPSKSCGACCGLYNWEDHSRKALIPLLEKRSALFFSLGRDPEIFQKACAREKLPPGSKLLEEIHNCEFLGFLDGEKKRVGCLLHPSVNEGRDLRDYCFYGKEICAGHFCPSHTHLTRAEQRSILAALEDWYLYGLVVTDIDLVKGFFHQVQTRLGDSLREERLEKKRCETRCGNFSRSKSPGSLPPAGGVSESTISPIPNTRSPESNTRKIGG